MTDPLKTDPVYMAGWNARIKGHEPPSVCPSGMPAEKWALWLEGYTDSDEVMLDIPARPEHPS